MSDSEDLFNFVPMNQPVQQTTGQKTLGLARKRSKTDQTFYQFIKKPVSRGTKIIKIEIYDTDSFQKSEQPMCNCEADAYERRFPSCPQIPVVVECVITDDSWSADDSQRQTTRRCQLNVEAPYLLKKMIGVDYIYFIQKNNLDLKKRVLEIEATNETFSSRVGVVEKCKYYVHPDNPEWTCFEQSALLDVKNFFGLESTVEKIAMKQYAANIAKGKELIDVFMKEVYDDGTMNLNPWKQGAGTENRELRRILSRGTEPLSPMLTSESRTHSEPGPAGTSKTLPRNLRDSPKSSPTPSESDDSEKHSSQKKGYFQRGRQKIKKTMSPRSFKRFRRSKLESEKRSEKEDAKLRISDEDLQQFAAFMPSTSLDYPGQGLPWSQPPCTCAPTSTGALTRWDNLLVVLEREKANPLPISTILL
ncbi:unnamed protein product [Spodoptera exigua]|nr:unnamed protein product [Spodoptera exigua]